MNYYNEFDRKAAAWLRELIKEGHIPDGWVDERSITDVKPHELSQYTQQHFFAGIGGWSLALRIAGWPDDRPVRTGSCPCQPFSQAGRQKGTEDERHLWPVFRDVITFGEPTTTFGEQVASKLGREWLAGIRSDLEGLGYAVGAADLCSAGIGSPNIRQRLWWVGDPIDERLQGHGRPISEPVPKGWQGAKRHGPSPGFWDSYEIAAGADGRSRRIEPGTSPMAPRLPEHVGLLRGYGNAINPEVAAEFIRAYLEAKGE